MLNYKKGDKIKVYDNLGKEVDAVFDGVDYPKDPVHYRVKLNVPDSGKKGYRQSTWYLPESRFAL